MIEQTGGPAFPINVDSEMTCLGMTMRDYFAAKAMQTMLQGSGTFESHAEYAYKMADYMLKERSK